MAQAASTSSAARLDGILSTLKTVVNDLTGIQVEDIDVDANFLEAGIDSLTLIQASQVMQEKFGVKLSVVQLLEEHNTISAVANYLDQTLPPEETTGDDSTGAQPSELTAVAPPPATAPQTASSLPDHQIPPPPMPQAEPAYASSPLSQSVPPTPAQSTSPVAATHVEDDSGPRGGEALERADGASPLERIMAQQLQLMSRQLDMLRGSASPLHANMRGAASPQPTQAKTAAPPVAPPGSPQTQTAATAAPTPGGKTLNIKSQPYIPYQPIEAGSRGGLNERQQQYLDEFIARYTRRTRESKRMTQAYRPYLADSRSSFGFRLLWKELVYPIVGHRSQDCRMWDVDGNEYLDIAMGFGIHLFGHSPAFIAEALEEQMKVGMQLGPQSLLAGQVAEMMSEMTGLERVNFCNSGTEAVIAAMRLARAVTRRDKIALFAGAYHGWSDGTLAKQQLVKDEVRSVPVAPGIPPNSVRDTLILDWDNPKSLEILHAHRHELAAVLVEPVQSRRPEIQPREFLHELRAFTEKTGAALIFDEMITGFRIHTGGAQAWFGVEADIATYGKVIGGGLPIGAIAGKPAFMDAFDGGMWDYGDDSYPQADKTVFAGAFFKHPLTMAAARAVLTHLKDDPQLLPQLNLRAARLVSMLNDYFAQTDLPISVVNYGSLFRFLVAPKLKWIDLFFYHMLNNGVFIWEGRNCFLSTAHTDEDLERILSAVKESVEQMRAGDFLPAAPTAPARGESEVASEVAAGAPASNAPSTSDASAPGRPPREDSRNNGGAGPAQVSSRAHAGQSSTRAPSVVAVLDGGRARLDDARDTKPRTQPQFSVYYFGNYEAEFSRNKYELLLKGARFADRNDFAAVWIPERHFHAFGGFSPNPSVVAAALSRETERLQIRAGSVVLPLHHPIRVAEEWSVVDNLSQGRVGISFASGWQPNDFVFAPDSYDKRYERMHEGIEVVKKLWRGEAIPARSGSGAEISVRLSPMPMQAELPMWLTGASRRTFVTAGEMGVRVLTNLQDQTVDELAEKIALYRDALARRGHDPAAGHVTVLLHTYVAEEMEKARQKARLPFYSYMKSSLKLMGNVLKGRQGRPLSLDKISAEDLEYVLSNGYERYIKSAALIGTPDSCAAIVNRLVEVGVDEIGCLLDFGVDNASVLESLPYLNELRQDYANGKHGATGDADRTNEREGANATLEINRTGPPEETRRAYSIPLTEAQRQLWITSQMGDEASAAYNESITLHMRGALDLDALRRALQKLVSRHESLRVTFSPEGDCQWVAPSVELDVPLADFSGSDEATRETEVAVWIDREVSEPFDLVKGPLVRGRVAKLEEHYHLLVITHHHLVADGESGAVLMRDLRALYSAERQGVACELPPARPFSEYVQLQARPQPAGTTDAANEDYWLEQFADCVPVLELPTDRPRPLIQTYCGAHERLTVEPALYEDLKRVSIQQKSTLLMLLFAATNVLMHRLSGQDDIVVGSPAAGQVAAGVKEAVGYCINMLPIRSEVADNPKFVDYLRIVRRSLLSGYEHQNYSPGHLVEMLGLLWDPSRSPLFSVTFNFDKSGSVLQMEDLRVRVVQNAGNSVRFDLCLIFNEIDNELQFECRYNTDLFDARTIRRWMRCCLNLLAGIASNPQQTVWDLPLLSEDERRQVLADWNDGGRFGSAVQDIRRLFEAQLADAAEATAGGHAPLADTSVYILDRRGNPVPVGVWGDLHVGGAPLSSVALSESTLTAERLIPDPFSLEAGARLYRTGDEARYLDDGRIELRRVAGDGKSERERVAATDGRLTGRQLEESYVEPRDETERTLAGIWAEVLQLERVGIENRFFDLGGHSLLALQIISRIRNAFQVELTMRHIFESPTVAQLAATVTRIREAGETHEEKGIESGDAKDEEMLLEEIDQLSDQEVDSLLTDILHEEEASNG
jgi:natural product biosynthesis luciferase-like monooxygenase protein